MKAKNIIVNVECLIARISRKLGHRKSIDPIPNNTLYCYEPDYEKNSKQESRYPYHIKPCKYYRYMDGQLNAGCTYMGRSGFEPLLGDQCKICGEKEDDNEFTFVIRKDMATARLIFFYAMVGLIVCILAIITHNP